MALSFVTICGNIATAPTIKVGSDSKRRFLTFRLAQNESYLDKQTGEFRDGPTSFYDVVVFGALGVNAAASLAKGDPIIVQGKLRVRQWEQGERKGQVAEIVAHHIGMDLLFGEGKLVRVSRAAAEALVHEDEAESVPEQDAIGQNGIGLDGAGLEPPMGEPVERAEEPESLSGVLESDLSPDRGAELVGVGR